jgi:hypothetical protein
VRFAGSVTPGSLHHAGTVDPVLSETQHPTVEPGLGGRLRFHRVRIALWIAGIEGVVVVFSHDLTKWTVMALAVIAGLVYLLGRNAKSNVLRQVVWIFATSQLVAFVLAMLGWIVKWALIGGLVVVAIAGIAYLFVDRR